MEALKDELERQRRLVQASYALHSTLDLDELLGLILNVAAEGVQADRGTVFLLDEGELWSRVLSGDERLEIRLPVGKGIAGAVAETGTAIRLDDAYEDPRFDRSWDEKTGYRTREVLCAPIRNRNGAIVGVFQLLNKQQGRFTRVDEEYLAALSVHAALAVENAQLHQSALEKERYDREVRLAQDVQRQLQPARRDAEVGVIRAAGINELCEDATGDYYDLLPRLPGDRIGVAIGDVSGHGLQAALVMAEARAYLRAFVRTADTPAEAVGLLNEHLVPDMRDGRFISLVLAAVSAGDGTVEWCNAGHNPPLLARAASGTIEPLTATGHALGILPGSNFAGGEPVTLRAGDVLLLYTDGVTEARNGAGELFGEERLGEVLRGAAAEEPDAIVERVRGAVRTWTGGRANEDDLTMLALKRLTG